MRREGIANSTIGRFLSGLSHPLSNQMPFVEPNRPAIRRRGCEIERNPQFRVNRCRDVFGAIFVRGRLYAASDRPVQLEDRRAARNAVPPVP